MQTESDLIIAYAGMWILSAVCGVVAAVYLYPRSRSAAILCVTFAVVAMFAYMLYGAGQLSLAHVVSDSAAIVWTNLTPIFAAIAAGWVLRLRKIPRKRKLAWSATLAACATLALFWPSIGRILRPPPPGGNDLQNGVVMQSSWATCSPAAAATLLFHLGIESSEAEMIPLCLTDSSGTPSLGLYRGLKLQAERHGRSLEVYSSTLDELLSARPWPMLLTVELPEYGVDDPRYEQQWGWIPGMGHSVVALEQLPSGDLLIGDPSVGPEIWSRQDLEVLWHGGGLRLTPTSNQATPTPEVRAQ